MSLLKKAVAVGGIIAVAAIIVVIGFKGTTQVSAQEIAQKSYQAVSALTPEQRESLKQTAHIGDPLGVLQEALNAKDLKVLTRDEFVSQYPENAKLIDSRIVKFLEFTNADGLKIALGIDKNNLPAFMSASYGQPPVEGQPSGEKSLNEAPAGAPEKGLNEVTK